MTRRRKRLLVLASLFGVIVIPFSYFAIVFYLPLHGITSLSLYRYVLERQGRVRTDVNVVEYFPPVIPPEASNPRFFYQTPAGDLNMQLRCVLPSAEVAGLVARVAPIAKATAHGSDDTAWYGPPDIQLWPPTFQDAENAAYGKLPATFTIYLIGIGHGDKSDEIESHWMYEYGVAVDHQSNEVIYWLSGHSE